MAQHFLLSTQARTLSLAKVMRLSDDEAFNTFKAVRWAETNGEPVCPKCGSLDPYDITTRKLFKCRACHVQFSVTSGTIFASRKLSIRDLLAAIAIFVNGAKGHSALQLSRDLDVQYRTAFVLMHKLREAMASQTKGYKLSGTVEIDGAYFGGYVKPENRKEDRKDLRLKANQTGKRKVVVVAREREGKALIFVHKSEDAAIPDVLENVKPASLIFADEASTWDTLHGYYTTRRVNHSIAFMDDGVCTNQAESFFSRLRRAEIGTHHNISGKYLASYAGEMAWRENNRRIDNGGQYATVVSLALKSAVSRQWKGYWQRHAI